MRRPLRLTLLVPVLLAAALVAGCGGSGGSSGADTDQLLKDTFADAKPVHSGRLKLGIDVHADGLSGLPSPLSVRLGGPFERTTGGGTPKFEFDVALSTRDGHFAIGLISTGNAGWLKIGQRAFTLPASEFRRLAPKGTSAGGAPDGLGTLGIDPRAWIENVEDRGVETLDGDRVIHLSSDVDIAGLAKDLDKLLAGAGGTGLNALAGISGAAGKDGAVAKSVESARVDVWTGERDHQLRRITIALRVDTPSAKDGTIRLDLAIGGLNQPQPIGPPANPRPLSELSAALAVLTQQRAAQATQGGAATGSGSYDDCLQAAGDDLSSAQQCASLLG